MYFTNHRLNERIVAETLNVANDAFHGQFQRGSMTVRTTLASCRPRTVAPHTAVAYK